MRIRQSIIIFSLLLSCKQAARPPQNLIPKNVMEKILLDVNIAEAYSNIVKDTLHRQGTKNTDSLVIYYKEIFNHYKITPEQFSSSLYWYKGHPDELDSMYNNIIPIATKWQATPIATAPVPANIDTQQKQPK